MTGTTIAQFLVREKLGGNGMGVVYKAENTSTGEMVALKFLREDVTQDVERMARFAHEVEICSSLHHPHIGSIYGLEESGDVHALVMELVEGSSLSERIAKGALPQVEALGIAKQVAEALEYAHERGIIHRDLKPGNVKVSADGSVKVLGFGMANAIDADIVATETGDSATLNRVAILARVLLGTAAYMSPEQVRGKPVDRRTDIWAFGCLLFEMLTGRSAFSGETITDTLAAVTTSDPNWDSLPKTISPKVREILERCLRKDPGLRLRDIGEIRIAMEDGPPAVSTRLPTESPSPISAPPPRATLVWPIVFGIAILAATFGLWMLLHVPASPVSSVVAYIPPPPETSFRSFGFDSGPAVVSPEGTKLAFTATDKEGVTRIWIRPLGGNQATTVPGTEDAALPFWSPNSNSLGFVANGVLKTVDLSNGSIQALGKAIFQSRGAWDGDGTILFETSRGGPIFKIPAAGGAPVAATALDKDDTGDTQPAFLPDGKHFLYVALNGRVPQRIEMASLETGESKVVLENALYPAFADGYLLFIRGGIVFAQPFDPASGALSGTPTPLAGANTFSVAGSSVLAYQGGSAKARLQWFDANGIPQTPLDDVAEYSAPRISPDGRRVLVSIPGSQAGTNDLWVFPATGGISSRLTFGGGSKYWCVWSPDGKTIAYGGSANDQPAIFTQPGDGSGAPEVLTTLSSNYRTPAVVDWSPDGRFLSFDVFNTITYREESLILPTTGDGKPVPASAVSADQFDANFSPDGHWLSYFSYETGRPEVYVVPFPVSGGKYQISHNGGWDPRWSKRNQLFFLTMDDRLTEADIRFEGKALEVEVLRPLFQLSQPLFAGPLYDVSPDGARFLTLTAADPSASRSITLMLNWSAVLRK